MLTAPPAARLTRLHNLLKSGHWRLSSFRHSRLPAPLRRLEALVTFRYDRPRGWVAQESATLLPGHRARKGRVYLRLGKPKPWPWSPGVYESHRSLLLYAGMDAAVKVRLPRRPVLTFELGLVPARMGERPMTVTLELTAAGGAPKALLRHALGRDEAGKWYPLRVDLSAHAGQQVTLRFAVAREGADTSYLGAVALGRPAIQGEAPDRRPNLVLVILDTVRHDALSCYADGRGRTHTPQLDGIARRGALFENAFTNAAWTRPSLMALFSSRYPHVAGATPRGFSADEAHRWYLRQNTVPTFFAHLSAQGYACRGLINNFFMLPHERVGHDHGLASFAHILYGQGPGRRDTPAITAAAERFLAAHKDHRFFLYVLYESAHSPYAPPKSARARLRKVLGLNGQETRRPRGPRRRLSMMERYRAEVIHLDDHVGRILAALKKNGLADNTYVVVSSDHGEVISRQHCFFIPRLKYRSCYSHSASLYDQVLHVPVVLKGPGIRPGRRVRQTYQHVDFVPTLLELMGLPALPGAVGQSHATRLKAKTPPPVTPRDVYAVGRWVTGLRSGRKKLILRAHPAQDLVQSGGRKRRWPAELYDLEKDPDERWNLAPHQPEEVARLRARLVPFVTKDTVPELPGMPRHLLRHLRALNRYRLPGQLRPRPRPRPQRPPRHRTR